MIMEKKKYLPLKVIHLAFMVLGLCLYVYALTKAKSVLTTTSAYLIGILPTIIAILALISGFIYLVHGYKKNAAAYYKGFVWILLIKEIITTVSGNIMSSSLLMYVRVIDLVLLTILTVGKDLGKTKSLTLVGLIFVGKMIVFVNYLISLQSLGLGVTARGVDSIGQIILTVTTCLMVIGKYLNKAERGTK